MLPSPLAGAALLVALLAGLPVAAHVDAVFPILPNGFLQRFPDEYGPASLNLGPPSPDMPGVPSSARVRIGEHEIELPLCIRKLLAIPASQSVYAHGSWYHDFSTLPPYLSFDFSKRRTEDGFDGYALLFDMEKGSLLEVTRWEILDAGAGRGTSLDPSERCDASELEALTPRRTTAPIPEGAFERGHGKKISDCTLTGSAVADTRCLVDQLAASDEAYAAEAGWFVSCRDGSRSGERLAEWRRLREHFCREHLPSIGNPANQRLEALRCQLELTEASLSQISEMSSEACKQVDHAETRAREADD